MDYREELMNFAQELKSRSGGRIEDVIIFGSAARGKLSEESDVDVLVVVKREGVVYA
jgi:predicted nucleotidyltransferase